MIGFLLTEAIDILYSLGKLSYNGAAWLYYWYTNAPVSKQKSLEMKSLDERVKELERLVNSPNEL